MKSAVSNSYLEILGFMVIFFADIQASILAIGFLIMTDTFVGVWGSIKHKGWESITSRKAGRIISKLILYPISLIVAKVAETYLAPSVPWIDVTAGIIASIEVKSIFENISVILGFNLWQKIKVALWKEKDSDLPPKKTPES